MRNLRAFSTLLPVLFMLSGCERKPDAAPPEPARAAPVTPTRPPPPAAESAPVRLGVDVLAREDFAALRGRRVGLITNPTGVAGDLRSTVDALRTAATAGTFELVALFGPEHGVRGDVPAGEKIADTRDPVSGLPRYSLYGETRKPTADMLVGIDTLVFDIQDIGSRSYTYISTMAVAMEAAAEHGLRFIVLDRPNPLGGERIEGRPLDLAYRSFVGWLPIPYVHGLTVGELARMINGEGWLRDANGGPVACELVVVPLEGWRRNMTWADTGLHWVPTSPHVPRADTAAHYAATGIMGELRVLSEGVGYPLPFELAGAPGLDPDALAAELNRRGLPGVFFRPAYWQPYYGPFAKQTCAGVHVVFTDLARAELTPVQFHVLDAVRKLDPQRELFGQQRDNMFDKVCGTDRIRQLLSAGHPVEEVLALWRAGVDEFRVRRAKYLRYD
ncbi:MAG: DUF1343 domain-containing protein [Planctomycetota bacterium]